MIVVFNRIGQRTDIEPLRVPAGTRHDFVAAIRDFAASHRHSDQFTIHLSGSSGMIDVGTHNDGLFTLHPVPPEEGGPENPAPQLTIRQDGHAVQSSE